MYEVQKFVCLRARGVRDSVSPAGKEREVFCRDRRPRLSETYGIVRDCLRVRGVRDSEPTPRQGLTKAIVLKARCWLFARQIAGFFIVAQYKKST